MSADGRMPKAWTFIFWKARGIVEARSPLQFLRFRSIGEILRRDEQSSKLFRVTGLVGEQSATDTTELCQSP